MRPFLVRSLRPALACLALSAAVGCGETTGDDIGGIGAGPGGGTGGAASTGGSGAGGSASPGGSDPGGSGAAAGGTGGTDCSRVACTTDDCPEGTLEVVPEGACCKICQPCAEIGCPAIGCGPGSRSVVPPGACCPVCEPVDCTLVDCAQVECASGTHPEVLPGDCCPTCVGDSSGAELCEAGRENLVPTMLNNLGEGIISCADDTDCVLANLTSQCGMSCAFPLNKASVSDALDFTIAYGLDNCSTCPETDATCPPVAATTRCTDGTCEILR